MYCSFTKRDKSRCKKGQIIIARISAIVSLPFIKKDTSDPLAKGKGLCAGRGKRQIESEKIPVPGAELPKINFVVIFLG